MLSMKEMFYGESEPVWILKPEKKEDNKKGNDGGASGASGAKSGQEKAPAKEEYSILNVIPFYPYYYPDYVAPAPAKKPSEDNNKKESKVVMKVPICCGECEDSVKVALGEMKGVKSVDCDTRREKVTVTATTAAAADILLECRKVFKSSRMWTNDD